LDFKLLVYKGFWPMVFGISPGQRFGPIAIKAPVSLGFLQFMALSEPRFLSGFFPLFGAVHFSGVCVSDYLPG
jgi:hypothetical protein